MFRSEPANGSAGVVVTNGAGSPRSGIYGSYTDEEMQKVRLIEQRKAAYVGDYACQIQLGYTSAQVKNASETAVVDDLKTDPCALRSPELFICTTRLTSTIRTSASCCAASLRCAPCASSPPEKGLRLRSVARSGLDAGRR